MLTTTFGFFDCPICVDFYLVPDLSQWLILPRAVQ
jgi:hypothetical protein